MPTWCALQEPSFSLPPDSIHSEPSPISLSEPSPFFDAKLPRLFASAGLFGEMIRNRLTIRSPLLLDPTSAHATALLSAPHEAAEVL